MTTPDEILSARDDEWLEIHRAAGRVKAAGVEVTPDVADALSMLLSAVANTVTTPKGVRVRALKVARAILGSDS